MSQQFSQQVVEQKIDVRTQSDLLNLPVQNILVEVAIATDRGLDEETALGDRNSILGGGGGGILLILANFGL